METWRIVTHAHTDSSRVIVNNRVYENISERNGEYSSTEVENLAENTRTFSPRKNIRFESGQAALVPRQYRNINKREQYLYNTLEKNLSRQQQAALQSQAHTVQKYRARLARYRRQRMRAEESINGSCTPPSEHERESDRRTESITKAGRSTPSQESVTASPQTSQSIDSVDVNKGREAGPDNADGMSGVYRGLNSSTDLQLCHKTGNKSSRKYFPNSGARVLVTKERPIGIGERKVAEKLILDKTIMLQNPQPSTSPPDSNFLSVNEEVIRPRAYTDPTSSGKGKMSLNLPEITIEDCSDPEDKADDEFSVLTSAPRRRANTCPEEFFNRRRKGRPPTPPPSSRSNSPSNMFPFKAPCKSPVSFVHHKLTKVSEDLSDDPTGSRRHPKASAPRRSSFNTVSSLRSELNQKWSLNESEEGSEESEESDCETVEVSTHESRKLQDSKTVTSYSSKECRYAQKLSSPLDGKPLQAC